MSSSASAVGAISPVIHETCEQATSVVRARHGVGDVAQRHRSHLHAARARPRSAGRAGRGARCRTVTISWPGPRSSPASTPPSPSLVDVLSATSSTAQPSTRAYAARSFVERACRASKCVPEPPVGRCDSSASRAARPPRGHRPVGPGVQVRDFCRTGNSARRRGGIHGAAGYPRPSLASYSANAGRGSVGRWWVPARGPAGTAAARISWRSCRQDTRMFVLTTGHLEGRLPECGDAAEDVPGVPRRVPLGRLSVSCGARRIRPTSM